MKKIVFIVVSIVLLLLVAGLLMPALVWDGSTTIHVEVRLVAENSSRPVKDAQIWVFRSGQFSNLTDEQRRQFYKPFATDGNGVATLSVTCGAGGSKGPLWKTGSYVIGHELIIEAPGYRRVCTPLANVLGGDDWPLRKKRHKLKLWMIHDSKSA